MSKARPVVGMDFYEAHEVVASSILRALAENPDVEAATYDPETRAINVTLTGKAQGFPCTITIGEKESGA